MLTRAGLRRAPVACYIGRVTELQRRVVILVGSPRREGNSATLARAVQRGAERDGHTVSLCFIDDFVKAFLGDCRRCRLSDGECSIDDGFRRLFFDEFLPADAAVFCSPIYWYSLSAQLKAFFDRTFCYYAASYPESARVIERMSRKRLALVLSGEETYPGASLGITHQLQEFARYTHSEFVGVVRGVANSRGEVARDPADPVADCERLGNELFRRPYTDYRLDTARSGRVWGS